MRRSRLHSIRAALGAALFALLAAGSAAAKVEPGRLVADPIAAAKEELRKSCLSIVYPDDFTQKRDLNGDGDDDLIIQYNVVCDGYPGVFCGQAGCDGEVYVARGEDGWLKTSLPPTVEPREFQGRPAVTVTAPGSACGRGPGRTCASIRVWDGNDFIDVKAARVRAEAAAAKPKEPARVRLVNPDDARDALDTDKPDEDAAKAAADRGLPLLPAIAPEDASARWAFTPYGPGRATAEIRGPGGLARFLLGCRAGDGAVTVALTPEGAAAARLPSVDKSRIAVDVIIGSRIRDTRLFVLDAESGRWFDQISADGPIIQWLKRGSSLALRESGRKRRIAVFVLSGSSRAIDSALQSCGLGATP